MRRRREGRERRKEERGIPVKWPFFAFLDLFCHLLAPMCPLHLELLLFLHKYEWEERRREGRRRREEERIVNSNPPICNNRGRGRSSYLIFSKTQ